MEATLKEMSQFGGGSVSWHLFVKSRVSDDCSVCNRLCGTR